MEKPSKKKFMKNVSSTLNILNLTLNSYNFTTFTCKGHFIMVVVLKWVLEVLYIYPWSRFIVTLGKKI